MGRPKKLRQPPDPSPNGYHYLPGNAGYTEAEIEEFRSAGPAQFFVDDGPRDFEHALLARYVCEDHQVETPEWARDQITAVSLDLLRGIDPHACLPLSWLHPAPEVVGGQHTRTELRHLRMALDVILLRIERPHLQMGTIYQMVGHDHGAAPKQVQRAYLEYLKSCQDHAD